MMRRCEVVGCGREHRARGYCGTHWQRWRKHGDPLAGVPVRAGEDVHARAAAVARMTRAGMSSAEIAARLGCTVRTVQRCRAGSGVAEPPPMPYGPEIRKQSLDMLRDGCSYREVAATLGCSPVRKWWPAMTLARAYTDGRWTP
ncbi:sigma-70 region 4 domain-containing protein [Gordonia sp. PP30]|uniref:helix-turn-helix domain-containing protein n=1 Tax=Gordonia sp. PP30 TaxID=2935861 RepID=UPI0020003E91|nr:helix-turn-helix domain-containing protein [Gordonia sp. PP30]UQE74223.1 sigma-70 region 4 domain-containing protein [Gordonia sp. PP30]